MAADGPTDAEVAAVAREYAAACAQVEGAFCPAGDLGAAVMRRSTAYHDLILVAAGACTQCDPGTCPGMLAVYA